MVPLRPFRPFKEDSKQIPFRKKYFVLCEGAKTEVKYLKLLINQKKEIGIKDEIEVIPLEKTKEDKDVSNPEKLLSMAEEWIGTDLRNATKEEYDRIMEQLKKKHNGTA